MKLDYGRILIVLGVLGLLVLLFYLGRWTKPCNMTGAYVVPGDTNQTVAIAPPVNLDTTKAKVRILHDTLTVQDSAIVTALLAEKDSLIALLKKYRVRELAILDTITKPANDTLKIEYDVYNENWNKVYVGISPRTIPVTKEFIYLPAPKREWWDNPVAGLAGGFILGGISGLIMGVSLK
jgi:hypothetical protein